MGLQTYGEAALEFSVRIIREMTHNPDHEGWRILRKLLCDAGSKLPDRRMTSEFGLVGSIKNSVRELQQKVEQCYIICADVERMGSRPLAFAYLETNLREISESLGQTIEALSSIREIGWRDQQQHHFTGRSM